MNNFMILETEQLIRATSPLQQFLLEIHYGVNWIKSVVSDVVIGNLISNDPLLMLPFGFMALMATIGIFKRILSRD